MHCIHCGAQIPDNAKFCTSCGRPVQVAPETAEQEPMTAEETVAPEGSSEEAAEGYTSPVNASEGYKSANAQLPPAYSNPNYSSQTGAAYTASAPSTTNGLAIGGFVCSLIFIPIGFGVLTAIAGLILSIMGMSNSKNLPENKGHGLALAGTIISAIRIALILIGLVALIALMFRGVGHVGHEIISNWSEYNPYNF